MSKKIIIKKTGWKIVSKPFFVLDAILISLLFFLFFSQKRSYSQSLSSSEVILFWGEGCIHCNATKDEIRRLGYDKKISIKYLEVYYNKDNAKIFYDKIIECGLSPKKAGVPMVYKDGLCWIGKDESIRAIKEEIEKVYNQSPANDESCKKEDSITEEVLNKGKRNTEIMLALIFLSLAFLVLLGYAVKSKKYTQTFLSVFNFFLFCFLFFSAKVIEAVCPVCTVAVGAGLGISRYLGIDDVITSLWIGGLIVSIVYWIIDLLKKNKRSSFLVVVFAILATYFLVLIPLYLAGVIGHPFNKFLGVDKVLFGILVGSLSFFCGEKTSWLLKKINKEKSLIPFQKVVIPIFYLWLASLVFYFIIYY